MVQITLRDQACYWLAISFGHCIRLCVRFSVAASWYLTCFLINHSDFFLRVLHLGTVLSMFSVFSFSKSDSILPPRIGLKYLGELKYLLLQYKRWFKSRPTVIVGLFLQQAIALFVLKTAAGFSIFEWLATLAGDFLSQALAGAVFFFDQDTINKGWFFVNTVQSVFSIAAILTWLTCTDNPAGLNHLFRRVYTNDVLSGCHAMDSQAFVSMKFSFNGHKVLRFFHFLKCLVFLQDNECFRCGGRCRGCIALDWAGFVVSPYYSALPLNFLQLFRRVSLSCQTLRRLWVSHS